MLYLKGMVATSVANEYSDFIPVDPETQTPNKREFVHFRISGYRNGMLFGYYVYRRTIHTPTDLQSNPFALLLPR